MHTCWITIVRMLHIETCIKDEENKYFIVMSIINNEQDGREGEKITCQTDFKEYDL